MKSVYSFKDYKQYLVLSESEDARGAFRTRLAKAAPCQAAYVSQVLNGEKHFSMEQMDGIAQLLSFGVEERRHWFLLAQYARAGTASLRKFFLGQIEESSERNSNLHHRVRAGETIGEESQRIYYSDWIYAAIHVLVTIEAFRSTESIAERLALPLALVKKALDFLVGCGLVNEKSGRYTTGRARIYLPGDSAFIANHHANWRLRSVEAVNRPGPEDLHYSSVVTVSLEDFQRIREELIETIKRSKEIIRQSPEEDIFSLNFDFFRL